METLLKLVEGTESRESKALALASTVMKFAMASPLEPLTDKEMFLWTQKLDPKSFGLMLMSYASKAGLTYEWDIPEQSFDETDYNYKKRMEASFLELTGFTLANMMTNAKAWIGVWTEMIIRHGLTLVPEFVADVETKTLAKPLDEWFDKTGVRKHLEAWEISRLKGFMLEVLPQARLYDPTIDQSVVPLLTSKDGDLSIIKAVRVATDAMRLARTKEGKAPPQLMAAVVDNLRSGGKNSAEFEKQVADMGYAPTWVSKKLDLIQVGAWLYGSKEDGTKAVDYLIEARGDRAIEFVEGMLGRSPFNMREDLGSDSDDRRNFYKSQLSNHQDHSGQERIPGQPEHAPEHGLGDQLRSEGI